jgi:hypothetical protein
MVSRTKFMQYPLAERDIPTSTTYTALVQTISQSNSQIRV